MNNFAENFQNALNLIEAQLPEGTEVSDLGRITGLSSYNFQRVFSALSGISVGEYIRNRKMSLAGQELYRYSGNLLDLAVKFGYDSLEGFNRAFYRFHGMSPTQAMQTRCTLNYMLPFKIHLSLQGGTNMEYRVETKEPFSVVGYVTKQQGKDSYKSIPELWEEIMHNPEQQVCGWYGICFNNEENQFDYMIGDLYDPKCKEIPDTRILSFPRQMYAVFSCKGQLPQALQSVNTQIWQEWLPSNGKYILDGDYSIEAYFENEGASEDYNEIWVPVKTLTMQQ